MDLYTSSGTRRRHTPRGSSYVVHPSVVEPFIGDQSKTPAKTTMDQIGLMMMYASGLLVCWWLNRGRWGWGRGDALMLGQSIAWEFRV